MIFLKRSIIILLVALSFFSCKKDKNILSNNVQPNQDLLNADFKTLNVFAYSKTYTAIACYNSSLKYLGDVNDPYFGNLNCGIYTNLSINPSNPTFTDVGQTTSAELILVVNGESAGNFNALNSFTVYTLDSVLNYQRVYTSITQNLHDTKSIVSYSASAIKFTRYNDTSGIIILKIPIQNDFADQIINDKNALSSNDKLQSKFKGFYIKAANSNSGTDVGKGMMHVCNLDHDSSGLYIKYKYTNNSQVVNSRMKFDFKGGNGIKFNTISKSFSNAHPDLLNQINGDTTAGSQKLFLKGLGVTKLKLKIPELQAVSDSFNIAVNRAELVLSVANPLDLYDASSASTNHFSYPLILTLLVDSAGKEKLVFDQITATDFGRYDGNFNSNNNTYVFNIPRHAQAILTGVERNTGFYVVVADPNYRVTALRDNTMDRIVLAGNNHPTLKPRFNLSYIKIKK